MSWSLAAFVLGSRPPPCRDPTGVAPRESPEGRALPLCPVTVDGLALREIAVPNLSRPRLRYNVQYVA